MESTQKKMEGSFHPGTKKIPPLLLNKHEEKYCPRCNAVFTCKAGDITNCQCTEVQVSGETKTFLEKTFFDCLCKACLASINHEVKTGMGHHFPSQEESSLKKQVNEQT